MLEADVTFRRGDFELRCAFTTRSRVTGVFGASGSGKTTLLHLIAGLLPPERGVIRLDDRTLFGGPNSVNVPVHRRRIGMVFQDDRLLPHLTVAGNLRYGRRRAQQMNTAPAWDTVIDLLNLGSLLDRRSTKVSGGERQRVALGRALLSGPRLLLMDEPLSSLDRPRRRQIIGLLQRVRDALEIPMLYVSHDLPEVMQLTDQLLILEGGRCVGQGSLAEVARQGRAWQAIRGAGPVNVIPVMVAGHDREAGLTRLSLRGRTSDAAPECTLLGPLLSDESRSELDISIRPEDIALSVNRVDGISIRNQIAATVREIARHETRSIVRIDIGVDLLVEVSHATVQQMNLAPGRAVWCLIKSNAVEYV